MEEDIEYERLPGLYRLWDLPVVLGTEEDYRVHYVEPTQDGTPLFAVYARQSVLVAQEGVK